MFAAAIALIAPLALTGSAAPAGGETYRGVRVSHGPDVTYVARGPRRIVLQGRFEHARFGPGFAPDGYAPGTASIVLEDIANHTTRARSRFAVVDTALTRAPKAITLRGDYTYDAIAADGRTLYLSSYFSIERPEQYAVRAYDLVTNVMDPTVVADKAAAFEGPMEGVALARAASRSGAWVYTAYRGAEHDFVHALDTINRTAVCVDMPEPVEHAGDWRLRLDERGGHLVATSRRARATLVIRTTDFTTRVVTRT